HLAAAELALVAIHGRVLLHFGDETCVAQPHAIAGGRSVDIGVVPPVDPVTHDRPTVDRSLPATTGPLAHALPPRMTRAPAMATRRTVLTSPGSKRTAVPAGMSRRMP